MPKLSLISRALVVIAVAGLVLGVGGSQDDPTEAVSFAATIQPFFNQQCVACHLTGAAGGGVNLEPGVAHEALVEVESTAPMLLVTPGDPELSYLVHKLRGTHLEVGGNGMLMPLGGQLIAEEMLDLVERWIAEGALDN